MSTLKETDKPPQTDKADKPNWVAYTLLVLLTICLIVLFTLSIWKTVTDLEAQRGLGCAAIDGNSDMYGLGIRLGVYMQLVVSSFVDSFGIQQYSSGLVASTLWFLLALSVALSMVLYNPITHSSEVYIIISLGNAVTTVMLNKIAKYDPLKSTESYLLSLGRLLLWGVWRASTSVYWFTLLHSYIRGSDKCGTWGWVFFRVDLYGSFRTLNQATNVLEWITLGILLLAYLIGTIVFCYGLWRINWGTQKPSGAPKWKFTVACDYLFVSIGELRQIMYGVTAAKKPTADVEKGQKKDHIARTGTDSFVARLEQHIKAHYTKQKLELGTNDGTGSVIPAYYLHGMHWCREKIQNVLGSNGFKNIKVPLLLVGDISTIAYTILNIEFSLRMNNIQNIYNIWSADQLIPIIIGAGGIVTALTELYLYKRNQAASEAPEQTTQALPEETHDKKSKSDNWEANQLEKTGSSNSAEITSVHVGGKL